MTVRLLPTSLSQKTLIFSVQTRPCGVKWALENKATFLSHGEPTAYIGFKTSPVQSFLPFSRNVTSKKVLAYLGLLDIRGLSLMRCLKQASDLDEEDVVNLLVTLNLQGFKEADIKSMLGKYPRLVRLKGSKVEECVKFYLGLGFHGSMVISLFVKRPSLLVYDVQKVNQVIEFLISMGMQKEEDLSIILSKRPHILEADVESLKNIVSSFLRAKLSQDDINGLFKRVPTVFTSSSKGNMNNSLEFWSSLGIEGKDLCRALRRRPNLLNYDTESMRNTYTYLQRWLDPSDVSKLASRFAELLAYDPQEKIEPLINYFVRFGLSEKDIGKVILRRPQLMACTIQRLDSTVCFLKGLGLKESVLHKVLTMSPQVFTLNANDKLRRGVKFFQSIGIDKERDMEFLFSRNAQIFCCSIEKNLKPTFDFFLSTGLDKKVVSKMVVLFPPMLGQNVERSLAPKYQYLVGDMNRSVKELVEFPQFFGYSLERRIKPRHKLLSELGVHISLPSMLACTEKDFHKRHILPYSLSRRSIGADKFVKKLMAPKKWKTATKTKTPSFMNEDPSYLGIQKPQDDIACDYKAGENVTNEEDEGSKHDEEILKLQTLISEKEDILHMESKVSVPVAQMHDEMLEEEVYPATFRKYYKNLSPCGIWIHAYKLEQ